MEIKRITTRQAKRLFSLCCISDDLFGVSKYKPLGRFFIAERNGHFTAIDNLDGYAWCEEFVNFEEMEKWFAGKPCKDIHGTKLNCD